MGKTAIVTGATRGIGKSILLLLSNQGYNVVGTYKKSDEKAKAIAKDSLNILMIKADAGNEADVKNVINQTLQKFGILDVVVNNAGIDLFGKIQEYSSESWDIMVNTNIKSVFLFSKYSIPHLKLSTSPIIINISSRIGYPQYTEPSFVVYGAVKAAVTNFTVGLSKELNDDNIRVCAIIPTPTKTDLFDEVFTKKEEEDLARRKKLGQPEDVAKLVMELIEDSNSNGKILIDKRVTI
jgi:3-oxoacyl-[acyl-carrier protein] reductase